MPRSLSRPAVALFIAGCAFILLMVLLQRPAVVGNVTCVGGDCGEEGQGVDDVTMKVPSMPGGEETETLPADGSKTPSGAEGFGDGALENSTSMKTPTASAPAGSAAGDDTTTTNGAAAVTDSVEEAAADPETGCFLIRHVGLDRDDREIAPPKAFFRVRGGGDERAAAENDDAGIALVKGIPAGEVTVTQDALEGWTQQGLSERATTVAAGSCAAPSVQVTFVSVLQEKTAALSVAIDDGRGEIPSGGDLLYTVTIQNTSGVGGSTPLAVTFSPSAFVAAVRPDDDGMLDEQSGVVTWEEVSVPAGAAVQRQVAVTVWEDAPAQELLSAYGTIDGDTDLDTTAIIRSTSPTSNTSSTSSTSETSQTSSTSLTSSFSLSATPSSPVIIAGGAPVTIMVAVRNTSTVAAGSMPVTLTLPSALAVVSAPGGSLDADQVRWTVPALPAGARREFVAAVRLTNDLAAGTDLTAYAELPDGTVDTATLTVAAPTPTAGCIAITTTGVTWDGGHGLSVISFNLDGTAQTVLSDGDGNAEFTAVAPGPHLVTEKLLAGWTPQSVAPVDGIVQVRAGACARVEFMNTQRPPPVTLALTHEPQPAEATAGATVTYAITMRNTSPVPARGVTVRDALPAGLPITAAPGGRREGQTVTWTLPLLAPGQSQTVRVTTRIPDDVPVGLPIRSLAAAAVQDPAAGMVTVEQPAIVTVIARSASRPGGIQQPLPPGTPSTSLIPGMPSPPPAAGPSGSAAFFLSITDGVETARPGQPLVYAITVRNTSTVPASAVTVRDALPSGLTIGSVDGTLFGVDGRAVDGAQGEVTVAVVWKTKTVTWTIPALAPGAFALLSLQATVEAALPDRTTIHNTAIVSHGGRERAAATDTTQVERLQSARTGCLRIAVKTVDRQKKPLPWVPPTLLRVGDAVTKTNTYGLSVLTVPVGRYAVLQLEPPGGLSRWKLAYMRPASPVTVNADACTEVTIVNSEVTPGTATVTARKRGCGDGICALWIGESCTLCPADCGECRRSAAEGSSVEGSRGAGERRSVSDGRGAVSASAGTSVSAGASATSVSRSASASSSASSISSISFISSISSWSTSSTSLTSQISSTSTSPTSSTSLTSDLFCDHRMTFPPLCPDYLPGIHNLARGTVMFVPPYIPAPEINPRGIAAPRDCTAICDRIKTTGECCNAAAASCSETTDVACDGMFFPYAAHKDCGAALRRGLCGGPR